MISHRPITPDTTDLLILACYFIFTLAIGVMFRRLSKNTSDYFRCGGAMPWWITGVSAWISLFSAWTFTGAAGKIYETGTLVLCLWYSNVLGWFLVFAWTGLRYRRLRVVTWMEAVKERYDSFTEQLMTCIKLPIVLLGCATSLNAIGVFMAAVFHVSVAETMIALGVVVTLVAFAGGAWAVLASNFIQMCLVVAITVLVAFLALRQPQIGGFMALLHKIPSRQYPLHWSEMARWATICPWMAVMLWYGLAAQNNLENGAMYLMAKSDRDARRMTLIPIVASIITPIIFFIPPLVAEITHPNLAAEYPLLKNPNEAAFLAVCIDVMPMGLMGLLLCTMLGATLTSMDAGVNKGVGIFVRSLYRPILGRHDSEKKLLRIGKVCTLFFGGIIVFGGLMIDKYRTINLFDFSNLLAAFFIGPLWIPLLFGLFIKKTPAWSGWSSIAVGFTAALCVHFFYHTEQVQHFMGWPPLNKLEATNIDLAVTAFTPAGSGALWFLFTMFFFQFSSQEHKDRVERFFLKMRTPIDGVKEGIANHDELIYRLVGLLCLVYGAFVLLLTLIPNPPRGRLCFVFIGGLIVLMGLVLTWRSRVTGRRDAAALAMGVGEPVVSK